MHCFLSRRTAKIRSCPDTERPPVDVSWRQGSGQLSAASRHCHSGEGRNQALVVSASASSCRAPKRLPRTQRLIAYGWQPPRESGLYRLVRQGVTLCFPDVGKGAPPLLLVHGLGCDHQSFAHQIKHFRGSHRVVAMDLRGHRQSDKPAQECTVSAKADDLAWLCFELGLHAPVIVGWGLGALVGLKLAFRHSVYPAVL